MSAFLSDVDIRAFDPSPGYSGVATTSVQTEEAASVIANADTAYEWREIPRTLSLDLTSLDDFLRAHIGSRDLLVWAGDPELRGLGRPVVGMTLENPFALPVADIFNLLEKTWYVLDVRGARTRGQLNLSCRGVSSRFFVRPRAEHEVITLNDEPAPPLFLSSSTNHFENQESAYPTTDEGADEPPLRTETRAAILILLRGAEHEDFENGMESAFERELVPLIAAGGAESIAQLRELLFSERRSNQVVAETLGVLSRMEDPRTYRSRLSLLHECLSSPSILVRDAAVLGIAELDDADSAPFLRNARATETCLRLREDMDAVLADLSE